MKKFVCVAVLCLLVSLVLASCGKITVTWLDGDGSLLYKEQVEKDEAVPQKPLPEDNDEWDYIEWKCFEPDDKNITYTASREAKDRYEWRDADGKVLHKESVTGGASAPVFELPGNTDKYEYTGWKQSVENGINIYTAQRYSGKNLLWKDVDGTVLYEAFVRDGEKTPERFLPNDSVDWHYTEWKQTDGGFVAVRIAKEKVHWLDADGTLLYTDGVVPGEEVVLREFPKNTKWIYKEWVEITEAGGEITYIAKADMNPDFFKGNVFQIVVKDIYGAVRSLGSGFVFNDKGWFITNYHVIENAVSADAVFEIKNYSTGDAYTTLDISHAYYSSPEKDIFIGRIEDYKSISSYYQKIPFVRNYEVGDKVFSVGYPSASVKMEIHEGETVAENDKKVNTLYSKLVGGSTYIPNTAYIAPGSSGGILVNEKLEVIGITTGGIEEKSKFVLGAAIETFNFQNIANNVTTRNEKEFVDFMYPETAEVIKLFILGETHENCVGLFRDSTGVYYRYIFTHEYDNMEEATVVHVYSNGTVACTKTCVWDNGDSCSTTLAGVYTGKISSVDRFTLIFAYMWADGDGYSVVSENINYSKDLKLTLEDYDAEPVGNVKVTANNIEFAKKKFNSAYEWLVEFLESVG